MITLTAKEEARMAEIVKEKLQQSIETSLIDLKSVGIETPDLFEVWSNSLWFVNKKRY